MEDTGLALGGAMAEALGDKRGIERYGFLLPMDESLAEVAIDLSGRPCLVFEGSFRREYVGELPTELVPHFFESLAQSLRCGLHLTIRRGKNEHHKIEALFKGLGVVCARRSAVARTSAAFPRPKGIVMIGILRYNAGNRVSVARALGRLGIRRRTVETAEEIAACDGLIFPGAGAAAIGDARPRMREDSSMPCATSASRSSGSASECNSSSTSPKKATSIVSESSAGE